MFWIWAWPSISFPIEPVLIFTLLGTLQYFVSYTLSLYRLGLWILGGEYKLGLKCYLEFEATFYVALGRKSAVGGSALWAAEKKLKTGGWFNKSLTAKESGQSDRREVLYWVDQTYSISNRNQYKWQKTSQTSPHASIPWSDWKLHLSSKMLQRRRPTGKQAEHWEQNYPHGLGGKITPMGWEGRCLPLLRQNRSM